MLLFLDSIKTLKCYYIAQIPLTKIHVLTNMLMNAVSILYFTENQTYIKNSTHEAKIRLIILVNVDSSLNKTMNFMLMCTEKGNELNKEIKKKLRAVRKHEYNH